MSPEANTLADPIAQVQASIEAARAALQAEIRSYPAPISGCDAQFNHLLEIRQKLVNAEAALRAEVRVPTSRNPDP